MGDINIGHTGDSFPYMMSDVEHLGSIASLAIMETCKREGVLKNITDNMSRIDDVLPLWENPHQRFIEEHQVRVSAYIRQNSGQRYIHDIEYFFCLASRSETNKALNIYDGNGWTALCDWIDIYDVINSKIETVALGNKVFLRHKHQQKVEKYEYRRTDYERPISVKLSSNSMFGHSERIESLAGFHAPWWKR